MKAEEGNPLKKNFGDWWREKKAKRKIKKAERKFEKARDAAGEYHVHGGSASNIKKAARKYRKGVKAVKQAEKAGGGKFMGYGMWTNIAETEDRVHGNYRKKSTR